MEILLIAVVFVFFMTIGVPIAFTLGLTSLAYLIFVKGMPLLIIGQRMFAGVDEFVLLAVPFFVLSGQLMNRTGITEDLIRFCDLLVGRIAGALAHINIVASILFAGITGAAVADVAALGSVLIPAMKKQGYSSEYSAAVTVTSSIIGPIIPPSIIMVIYGSVVGESIAALFLGGFAPGLLIGFGLMAVAYYYAKKQNHPRRTSSITVHEGVAIVRRASLGLLVPVILIGGILSGMFTATEAAAVAAAYAFLVDIIVFRRLTIRDVRESLLQAALVSSVLLLIIASAKLLGIMLTIERVPDSVAAAILSISDNRYLVFFLINIFLLFMGMIMETGAIVIILAPILVPVAVKVGIDPLHFALVMLVNVNIGLTTPPLGVCLFAAAPIAQCPYERIALAALPFIFVEIAVLFLITYFPAVVLFLPTLAGFH